MGRVTRKRMSEIKGNFFKAARILSSGETLSLPSGYVGKGQMWSGGLESSKAGFCWIYNSVFCSYQKGAESKLIGRCHSCPEMMRALREEHEEEEADDCETEEVLRRRFVEKTADIASKAVLCCYDGELCRFNEHVCKIGDAEAPVFWFCDRQPKSAEGTT